MRDYKKELEWEKGKYKRLVAKIDKDLAEEFLKQLNKPFSTWLREQIKKTAVESHGIRLLPFLFSIIS